MGWEGMGVEWKGMGWCEKGWDEEEGEGSRDGVYEVVGGLRIASVGS